MDEKRQRAIASEGGRAAHQRGTAHEFTSEEAREAGRRGGESVSRNREHMARIGRKGGVARAANNATKAADTASSAAAGKTAVPPRVRSDTPVATEAVTGTTRVADRGERASNEQLDERTRVYGNRTRTTH